MYLERSFFKYRSKIFFNNVLQNLYNSTCNILNITLYMSESIVVEILSYASRRFSHIHRIKGHVLYIGTRYNCKVFDMF